MGIGGGIVADSKADSEFEECLLKAHFLTKVDTPFELIETLRFEKGNGFHLLERHLARLQSSAAHFGYPFSREAVLAALDAEAARVEAPVALVRLLLGEDGDHHRHLDRDHAAHQGHGVALRDLRPAPR